MPALLTDRPQKALEEGVNSHKPSHVHVLLCKCIRVLPIAWVCETQTPWSRGDGLLQAPTWAAATKPDAQGFFFFFFHFGSCSGWRLKHRVSKPKQKPPSPPRHGRCLGKGLILQKFDPNLCEDSGDCKNPGAYMGFLKLVISWEELQPLPGNITRSSTGMFKALRKKLWLFSLLNAWGCTDPGVCLSQWSTRCHPPLGPAENPCLIVTVHLKLLKPGGFFLLLEFQESLCTALWFSRWVSRSPTPHQLQTAKFSKHYENTKKG